MENFLVFFLRFIANWLNWRIIRGLGELQVLTRASYAALVVVPLLAGTWPAVRLVVNQHNKAVIEATQVLKDTQSALGGVELRVSERLRHSLAASRPSGSDPVQEDVRKVLSDLSSAVARFEGQVQSFVDDFSQRTIPTPRLPWALAATFFAALFVAVGHMTYQLGAPEPVRRMTWDEFVMARKEDYAKHHSGESLRRAANFATSKLSERAEYEELFEAERLLRRLSDLPRDERLRELNLLTGDRLEGLALILEREELRLSRDVQIAFRDEVRDALKSHPGSEDSRQMTMIERGARAEYLRSAERNRPLIVFTALLYLTGLVLIARIVDIQARAVIAAAGWVRWGDLFRG